MSSQSGWGRSMRGGVLWSNASFIATRAVSTISLLILARLLTPSDFGVVAAIAVYIALLELTSDLGMKATVIYEQEEGVTDRVQSAFTLNVLISAVLTAVGVLLAPEVAGFFEVPEETDLFRLAALGPLLHGFGNVHDALLLRSLQFRRRAVPEFAAALTRAGVSIPLAVGGLGAESLVFGLLAGNVVWSAVLWVLSPFRPTFSLDPKIVRTMAGYGGGAVTLNVLSAVGLRVDQAVVGRVLGERALGLYTVAFRIPELLIESVAWNVSRVAFPGLSQKRSGDAEGVAAATARIMQFQALYAVPVAAGLAVLATPLMVVLFGPAWEAAGGVASAVAVTSCLSAVAFPLGDAFKAIGKQRVLVVLNVIQLPLYVAVVILVAPAGIVAVAWARTGAEAVHTILVAVTASRALQSSMGRFVSAIGPALAVGGGVVLGAGAVRLLWDDLSLAVLTTGCAAAALGAVVSLRLLAPRTYAEVAALVGSLVRRLRRPTPA